MLLTCLLVASSLLAAGDPRTEAAVARAGNSATDEDILAALEPLAEDLQLDPQVRRDAARLCEEIRQWRDAPKLYYFDKQVLDAGTYDFGIAKDSPLYPLCEIYLARMRVWVALEYGGYWSDPEKRRALFDEIRPRFERLAETFPENPLIKMYLGVPVPPEEVLSFPPGAPAWAVAQREALCRLREIILWWIHHRMRDDGQYGGGWGDDCEMWRWWAPLLVAFEDPEINAAQERFSKALLAQPHMRDGYTSHVYDVEHTSEDSADVLTPMMHLQPQAEAWKAKTLRLVDLFEHLWTGANDRGQLQFKSTYFSVDQVDLAPARACDTVYHPRAVQPALLYWQRTADPRLTQLFSAWMDTWVDAAAREERGKPAGILPSAIHWPDGAIGGLGSAWWDPENHPKDPLYVFPSAMGQMLNTLLQTYALTGAEKYLAPIQSMAQARLEYLRQPPAAEPEPGSRMWCAARLGSVSAVAAKYRLLTGRRDLDAFLQEDSTPYAAYLFQEDLAGLTSALQDSADALRVNFWGYTSEVRYTDRVLRFPALFDKNGMFPQAVPAIRQPDTDLLYSSLTGDPGSAQYFPLNAVRWHTLPGNIAALVKEASTTTFEAELFTFEPVGALKVEFLRLLPGPYRLDLRTEVDNITTNFTASKARAMVDLDLKPHSHYRILVTPERAGQ